MKKLLMTAMIALAVLALAPAAKADSITDKGVVFTLTYTGNPSGSNFTITLTMNTSTYTGGGSPTGVQAAAFKVSSTLTSFTLTSAPGSLSYWTTYAGGTNSSGCSGSGGGFGCEENEVNLLSVPDTAAAPMGGTLVWSWNITIPAGTLFTGALQSSVKAVYGDIIPAHTVTITKKGVTTTTNVPAQWNFDDQTSRNITLQTVTVPEPGTMTLLGSGLLGLGLAALRRRLL